MTAFEMRMKADIIEASMSPREKENVLSRLKFVLTLLHHEEDREACAAAIAVIETILD